MGLGRCHNSARIPHLYSPFTAVSPIGHGHAVLSFVETQEGDPDMRRMPILSILLVVALLGPLAAGVLAHGGGLDASGGHHDRKHGGYHFHRGTLVGQHFASRAAALAAMNAAETSPGSSLQSVAPTPAARNIEQRLEALTRLLVRKGVLTETELAKELRAIR